MMIRNYGILWVLSIAFELMELTFQVSHCQQETDWLVHVVFSTGCQISMSAGGTAGSWMCSCAIALASGPEWRQCECSTVTMRSITGWALVVTKQSWAKQSDHFSNCFPTLGTNLDGTSIQVGLEAVSSRNISCMALGPKRCLQVSLLMLWILAVEVQAFFLKYILWIPPRNLLNTYRLIIWFRKAPSMCH